MKTLIKTKDIPFWYEGKRYRENSYYLVSKKLANFLEKLGIIYIVKDKKVIRKVKNLKRGTHHVNNA